MAAPTTAPSASASADCHTTGGVVGPGDVAALSVHLVVNQALTGATYDIGGSRRFVAG